jgi:hypothetical protein
MPKLPKIAEIGKPFTTEVTEEHREKSENLDRKGHEGTQRKIG